MRRVIYTPAFDGDTIRLGGIARVQQVIDPLVDAVQRNPEAFSLLDVQTGIRYAVTRKIETMPALIITFTIDDDGDIIMLSVEARF